MGSSQVQRFGQYVILDRIGDGGMAEIFLAKRQGYLGFEKLIALKRILPRYSQNPTFAQMLIHEAKLAACLQHHNVVQVYDLGEFDKQVYIAMEYVHGRDLAVVLSNTYRRRERLPLPLTLWIATEFMTGLDYAHRVRNADGGPLGIIHRDISPQNILLSYEGEVKVTDFGIARVIGNDGLRLPGNLHGKFGYMSPEQVTGQGIDQRSDVFSAGVVLYEMLTGQRLFRGKDHKDTIKMIAAHPIPPPSTINPEVPASVDRVCEKALARDRDARYLTMGALLGALSRIADSLPQRAVTRDLSVYMRRQFGNSAGGFGIGIRGRAETTSSNVSLPSGLVEPAPPGGQPADYKVPGSQRVPIGQILLAHGAVTMGDIEIALAEQRARGGRIGEILLASGTIGETDLLRALAVQSNLPAITESELASLSRPNKLLMRFPREAAEATLILPISVNEEERSVALAVNDPYDDRSILETKVVLGVNDVVIFLAKRSLIRSKIIEWYGLEEIEASSEPVFPTEKSGTPGPPVVLLADSDAGFVREFAARLSEEECEVLTATNGKVAREICQERQPAVIFLEAALPVIDGYNILLEVRSRDMDSAVFITSSRGDEFRQAKALELGADDFIVKPLSLEVVTSKIRREVKKRAMGRRSAASSSEFQGVSGSLKDMTAIDIVQSLEIGAKTAHVVLQYEDGRSGELSLVHGEVRGAKTQDATGEPAFHLLSRPGKGLFRIEYRDSPLPQNISKPNTFLMVEAMRHIDEIEQKRRSALKGAESQDRSEENTQLELRRGRPTPADLAALAADLSLEPPKKNIGTPARVAEKKRPSGAYSLVDQSTPLAKLPLRRIESLVERPRPENHEVSDGASPGVPQENDWRRRT